MPTINFKHQQKVTEELESSIDVPQEVIDDGDDAVVEYIQNNEDSVEFGAVSEAHIEETLIDIEF